MNYSIIENMKHGRTKRDTILCQYDGLSDVLNTPVPDVNKSQYKNTIMEKHSSSDWLGVSGTAFDAIDLFVNGWTDGVKLLSERASKFSLEAPLVKTTITRPRQRYADEGEAIDIQAMLRGDYDTMWHGMERRTMDDLKTRVSICVNVGGNAKTKASELQWPGILASVLAHRALENGFDVKITEMAMARDSFDDTKMPFINAVTLKSYDEPISGANLAPLMLPAIHRAVNFTCRYHPNFKASMGLGISQDMSPEHVRAALGASHDDGTLLYIPRIRSHADAVRVYKELMNTINTRGAE